MRTSDIAKATALMVALGFVLSCATMRRQGADDRLFQAAQTGDLALAREAISQGADPLAKSEHDLQTTPLEMARANGYAQIVDLMETNVRIRQK